MLDPIKLNDRTYYVGVNDRQTDLFEGIWPLPRGVSYNSYLIVDQKVALIDTVKKVEFDTYLARLRKALGGRGIDYVIVNHLEPDHSGSDPLLREVFPDAKFVGNKKTAEFIGHLYGIEDMQAVEDGGALDLGKSKLSFHQIPMVHWPESMVTYDASTKTLFSNDAFGGFGALDGGIFDGEADVDWFHDEIVRYFSNIVGKYSAMVQKALAKLEGIEIDCVAPSHGLVWRDDPGYIMGLYDRLSKQEAEEGALVAYASMYGNTERLMETVARAVAEAGCPVRVRDVGRTHPSFVLSDAWRFKGLVLGAPTYDSGLLPPMANLLDLMKTKQLKNRSVGLFGSYGWAGGGMKAMRQFVERNRLDLVEPVVETRFAPAGEDDAKLAALGRAIAQKVAGG